MNPFQFIVMATFSLLSHHNKDAGVGDLIKMMEAVDRLQKHVYKLIIERNPKIAEMFSDDFYHFLTLDDMRVTGITDEALLKEVLAIWHNNALDVPVVNVSREALSEFALYELMTKLGPESFTCMLDALEIPEIERHKEKPIADQAILVLRYLKPLSGGLDRLRTYLTVSFPDLLKRS